VVPDILMHCTVAPVANSYSLVEPHTHAMGFQVECTHLKVDLEEGRSILVGCLAYKLSHACCLSLISAEPDVMAGYMSDKVECHKDLAVGVAVVVEAVQSNLYLVDMIEILQKQYLLVDMIEILQKQYLRIRFEGLPPKVI